jgi:endonuclease VIII
MPEGDTIRRTARTLGAALVGRTVTAFTSPIPQVTGAARRHGVVGSQIAAVEPIGKHLLIRFSVGAVLRTHMRMTGSWHLYRHGSPWRKPARLARAVVEAGGIVAVCFSAPVVELLSDAETHAHPDLRSLGPDLLADDFDEAEALARLRARPEQQIGVALLDQTALAGIGNVYKSEVLFLCNVDPFDRLSRLDDETLLALIRTARREMQRNMTTGVRRTRPDSAPTHFWVYGRAGQPCARCRTPIRLKRQGDQARSTYWCPCCQPDTRLKTGVGSESASDSRGNSRRQRMLK